MLIFPFKELGLRPPLSSASDQYHMDRRQWCSHVTGISQTGGQGIPRCCLSQAALWSRCQTHCDVTQTQILYPVHPHPLLPRSHYYASICSNPINCVRLSFQHWFGIIFHCNCIPLPAFRLGEKLKLQLIIYFLFRLLFCQLTFSEKCLFLIDDNQTKEPWKQK